MSDVFSEQVLLTVDALFKWFSEIRRDAANATGKDQVVLFISYRVVQRR